MSVLMTLRVTGDVAKLERLGAEDPSLFSGIIERAKERGLISHRFWTSGDEVLVVDEWPSEEAFQGFYETTPEIQQIMQYAGVREPPEVSFWQPVDTRDEYPPTR
jgi:heme-degrading monooxygenase HmoA